MPTDYSPEAAAVLVSRWRELERQIALRINFLGDDPPPSLIGEAIDMLEAAGRRIAELEQRKCACELVKEFMEHTTPDYEAQETPCRK